MAFHYSRPRPTQHLMHLTVLAAALALGTWPPSRDGWRALVEGSDPWVLLIGGTWLLHQVVFWAVAGAYHYVDTHDRPQFIARYRIHTGTPKRPGPGTTVRRVLINQLLWAPLMLTLMAAALGARGWAVDPELPSAVGLFVDLAGLTASAVVVFYATHRFLHRPWWMKRVHKVHHEFKTTCAMASEYAHPFEFCTGNFGTLAAGVVLIAPSLPAIYLFAVLSLLTILVHHGGYALPWATWALPHDWHHHRFKELFGTVGLMDRIFGTDLEFRELEDGDVR